jgi:S1-C subfamily serine protease
MFASSFLAGPRLVALGAVLTFFLPLTSPKVANGLSNGLSNEWSYAAPSRQSGKFIDKTQVKTPQPVRALTEDAKARVRNAVPAVGLVMAEIGDGRKLAYRGSAVVVRSDGIVVTNHHVIYDREAEKIYEGLYFRLRGEIENAASSASYRLEVVALDRPRDLALLRVIEADGKKSARAKLNLASLELGDEKKLELLDDLVVIGFPEKGGASATLSVGVVEGIDLKGGWIKTNARLLHGNSGGAAVNSEGKLIGIATKVISDETESNVTLGMIGYLRSVDLVRQMVEKLQEAGRDKEKSPSPARTGAHSARHDPAPAAHAVIVRGVVKDARTGNPIAGARVGLLVAGGDLDVANIITWGGTNADGKFTLEKPVLPGKYTLRAKVIGDVAYAPYGVEVEIGPDTYLIIEMNLAREQ